MKKLFIFDMGGVVASNVDVMPDVLSTLGMTLQEFRNHAGTDLGKLSDGTITSEQFWKAFSARSGVEITDDPFAKFFRPRLIPGSIEIIRRLKTIGRVVCGTNTYDCHYEIHEKRGDYEIFHAVYASNLMGVSKPDGKFFLRILSEESVKPEEAVFIDDREENVFGAGVVGIESFLFHSPDRLADDLRNAGIPGYR